MNHNNVISLPTDGTSTYKSGDLVTINSDGQATLSTGAGLAVGVVLQDVQATETTRPVDIQLISGGGIALVNATGTINIGAHVGYANGAKSLVAGASAANKVGIAMEALGVDVEGLIRVALL